MQAIWQRIVTALILVPLVVVGIVFTSNTNFAILIALVLGLAAWEWSKIVRIVFWYRFLYVGILWITFIVAYFLSAKIILLFSLVCWLWAAFFVIRYPKIKKRFFSGWLGCLLGLLFFVPCWIGFDILHSKNIGYLFLGLFVVWAMDTGAYFVGKKWGKHKLAKQVSPNKTIEGLVGGLFLSLLVSVCYSLIWKVDRQMELSILTVIVAIFSVIGDLFESMLKRIVNIKDSGNILPGHGGILDRIDSLLAAIPLWTLGLLFLKII